MKVPSKSWKDSVKYEEKARKKEDLINAQRDREELKEIYMNMEDEGFRSTSWI